MKKLAVLTMVVTLLGCGSSGSHDPEPEVLEAEATVETWADQDPGVATWACKCAMACGQADGTFVEASSEFIVCEPGDMVQNDVSQEAVNLTIEELLAQGCTADLNTAASCICVFVEDYCEDDAM